MGFMIKAIENKEKEIESKTPTSTSADTFGGALMAKVKARKGSDLAPSDLS